MKRLGENTESLDPGERLLSDLFESMPRTESDPFAKRRIRARIGQRAQRPRRGLKFAVTVGCISLATGAAAMAGSGRLSSTWKALFSSEQARAPKVPPQSPLPALAPESEPTAQFPPAASQQPAPEPVPLAPSSVARAALPSGEDPTLVASAIQALRSERDPARARQLLNRYLKANPRGALAEDALALSIEAAVAMKDKQSLALARSYLAAYPNGRHRKLAQQLLDKALAK